MDTTPTTFIFSFDGMWIFLSIIYICDTWLFSKGYNSFFHSFKTTEEKELRKYSIAKAEKESL